VRRAPSPANLRATPCACATPPELDNHLGIGDKTLAEFIISLADGHTTPAGFRECLAANGAEVPLDFCATLLTIIKRLRPATATAGSGGAAALAGAGADAGAVPVKYPGLAKADTRQRAAELSKELIGDRNPLFNAAYVHSGCGEGRWLGERVGRDAMPTSLLRLRGTDSCPLAVHAVGYSQ